LILAASPLVWPPFRNPKRATDAIDTEVRGPTAKSDNVITGREKVTHTTGTQRRCNLNVSKTSCVDHFPSIRYQIESNNLFLMAEIHAGLKHNYDKILYYKQNMKYEAITISVLTTEF